MDKPVEPSSRLELRHLRYFLQVAQELNLSRAARLLHISQPPLTRQIQQLESLVGTQLFVRGAQGMQLTEAGAKLQIEARNVLVSADLAIERTRSVALGQSGRLHIGAFGSVLLGVVPSFLALFQRNYPGVELTMHTLRRHEQLEALRHGRISAAFIRASNDLPDGVGSQPFAREHLLAAVPSVHELARRKRLRLRDLAGCAIVMQGSGPRPNFTDTLLALFSKHGVKVDVVQTVDDSIAAVSVVAAGLGVALVPGSIRNLQVPGVTYIAVEDIPGGSSDLMCIFATRHRSPALRSFLEAVREFHTRPDQKLW